MSNEQHSVEITVSIDGNEEIDGVSLRVGGGLERVMVEQRLGVPDYFSADIKMMENKSAAELVVVDELEPGKEVCITMGYGDRAQVFVGEISYIEPRFSEEEMVVTVAGYDYMHRLTRGTNSRTKGDGIQANVAYGDFAGEIIGQAKERGGNSAHGLSADASGGAKANYAAQFNVNDFQYLTQLGMSSNKTGDSRNADDAKKVSFAELSTDSAEFKICRDKMESDGIKAMNAEFTLSTVNQVARVEVRGFRNKKAFCGKHEKADAPAPIEGKEGFKYAGKHWGSESAGAVHTVVDFPVEDKAEADELAKSIFNSLAMEFIRGTVTVEGRAELAPGKVVELFGFGDRFSGKYLIESVVHQIDGAAEDHEPYTCAVGVVRNSAPG